jgi:hypothetical protein
MPTKHDKVAERIARSSGTDYNKGKGADVQTSSIAVEVETERTPSDGLQQLQGHRKPSYIAGTNPKAVEKAIEATEGTTVGVMDEYGNIVRRSTRRRR